MSFTYDELRDAVLQILKEGGQDRQFPNQLSCLTFDVNMLLRDRYPTEEDKKPGFQVIPGDSHINSEDKQNIRDIFYDLFRQGVISPGNGNQEAFPFFHISRFGRETIESNELYFFYDMASYVNHVRSEIPDIHPDTLMYLKESMQAFRASCYFSSSVMVGVATEHTFLLLLESAIECSAWETLFKPIEKQKDLANKVEKFKVLLESGVTDLPKDLKTDLDTQFSASLACIRTYRNQAGHPTGFKPSREKSYIAMQLFIPYCRKIYKLKSWFDNYGK